MRAFAQDVRKLLADRQRVVIVSAQARRVAEVFGDEAILGQNGMVLVSPATDLPDRRRTPARSQLVHGRFPEGWHSRSLALSVFTDAEIFGWSKRRGEQRRAAAPPPPSWPSCAPATSSSTRITASGASRGWSSSAPAASSANTC